MTARVTALARDCGADGAVVLKTSAVVQNRACLDMCSQNACGAYGNCWMCPPDAGDIETLMGLVRSYRYAVVFQIVRGLEDCFDIESMGKGTLVSYTSAGYFFMVMNQTVEYFADKNVRQAIDLAINRDDIVAVAVDGLGKPAGLPIREGLGGYVDGVEPTSHNLEEAKALMAQSAYPDGFTFTALVPGSNPYKKAAEVVQMQLAQLR